MNLGICRPPTVISKPIPHILILDNIIKSKRNVIVFQQRKKGLCKSTFWIVDSSLYEDDYLRFFQDAFDFWMPD